MRKARLGIISAITIVGFLGGVQTASATDTYTYVKSWTGYSGHCALGVDLLLNNTDHHNYQQGHAVSTNGDHCSVDLYMLSQGQLYTDQHVGDTWGPAVWSTVWYDGPGFTMQFCVEDLTSQADGFCTKFY
ncbi:hypothetical protein GCM10009665_45060 [Kitasatospora nipponensis]|uniref:Secreted protein n=1 Tax=Kitasatospora nipponensis TaxID=258049 RepID=A0ABN1WG42_9ACTN